MQLETIVTPIDTRPIWEGLCSLCWFL